jgi:hypothetical protein
MVLMMASLFWAIPEISSASRYTFVRFRRRAVSSAPSGIFAAAMKFKKIRSFAVILRRSGV